MNSLSLYKLEKEFENALLRVDEETGELPANFNDICRALVEKREAYVGFIMSRQYSIAAAKEKVKQIQDRIKKEAERIDRMAEFLIDNMDKHNVSKIEAKDLSFCVSIKINPPKVVIDETAQVPDEYLLPPKPREPDKRKIKEGIENGVINWARLEQTKRLSFS